MPRGKDRHGIATLGIQPLYGVLEFSPDGSTTASGSDGGNAIGFLSGASAFYTQQLSSRVSVGLGDFSDFGLAFEYDSGAGPTPSRSASA